MLKQYHDKILKIIYVIKTERWLIKQEREKCYRHSEWEKLSLTERKSCRKKDYYANLIYKNIRKQVEKGNRDKIQNFISDSFYQTYILRKLNKWNYTKDGRYFGKHCFVDKNFQELFFPEMMSLGYVLRNIEGIFFNKQGKIINQEEALRELKKHKKLVFKETIETGHGKGVRCVEYTDYQNVLVGMEKNFIVQEILEQHSSLAYYNETSVNVIRITTINWKGEVYILGGILRIGAPGSFCDHLKNGNKYPLVIPLTENGTLVKKAIDCDNGYVYEDVYGKQIQGSILHYDEMKDIVAKAHSKYPNYGIIGWDLTLDQEENIRCIEYNARVPGIVQTQLCLGPVFEIETSRGKTLLEEIVSCEME